VNDLILDGHTLSDQEQCEVCGTDPRSGDRCDRHFIGAKLTVHVSTDDGEPYIEIDGQELARVVLEAIRQSDTSCWAGSGRGDNATRFWRLAKKP